MFVFGRYLFFEVYSLLEQMIWLRVVKSSCLFWTINIQSLEKFALDMLIKANTLQLSEPVL